MNRWEKLSDDTREIQRALFSDQELAKLLLVKDNPLDSPDIIGNPSKLKHIITTNRIESKDNSTNGITHPRIYIIPDDIRTIDNGIFKINKYVFTILLPEDFWDVRVGGIEKERVFYIMSRIEEVIKNNNKLSLNGMESSARRYVTNIPQYDGYVLIMENARNFR